MYRSPAAFFYLARRPVAAKHHHISPAGGVPQNKLQPLSPSCDPLQTGTVVHNAQRWRRGPPSGSLSRSSPGTGGSNRYAAAPQIRAFTTEFWPTAMPFLFLSVRSWGLPTPCSLFCVMLTLARALHWTDLFEGAGGLGRPQGAACPNVMFPEPKCRSSSALGRHRSYSTRA